MKVLIVDDAVAYRSQLKAVISEIAGVEVVGTAPNGSIALQKIAQTKVDLMILDIEMPEMSGIETVEIIKEKGYSDIKIIMFSGLSRTSADLAFRAMQAGADDVVAKPGSEVSSLEEACDYIRDQLVPKIKFYLAGVTPKEPIVPVLNNKSINLYNFTPRVIVLASSTGGPQALEELFEGIGSDICPPLLIVQHMPPLFTKMLAERLDKLSNLTFREAEHGEKLTRGTALIAPGDFHLEVASTNNNLYLEASLHQGPKQNSVRPAADYLFVSAAKVVSNHCLGIVLTGMGQDGEEGAIAIKNAGGGVFIQDKKSCVVWGMPAAVHRANAFDQMGDISACRQLLHQLSV